MSDKRQTFATYLSVEEVRAQLEKQIGRTEIRNRPYDLSIQFAKNISDNYQYELKLKTVTAFARTVWIKGSIQPVSAGGAEVSISQSSNPWTIESLIQPPFSIFFVVFVATMARRNTDSASPDVTPQIVVIAIVACVLGLIWGANRNNVLLKDARFIIDRYLPQHSS